MNKSESLEQLSQQLGVKDTIEVLEYALPRIIERQEKIHQHLQMKNWQAASKDAHQIISSVRLYGSDELEKLLKKVKDCQQIEANQLSTAFNEVIQAIQQWLITARSKPSCH
jgi:HPt (histidine-containing phosphotransfer) domain-containing protein